jgi:predicted metal-dependent phosphotriesterase family hydrolase
MIQAVRGPVPLGELGQTMMHEHVFWDFSPRWRERSLAFARQELSVRKCCSRCSRVISGV